MFGENFLHFSILRLDTSLAFKKKMNISNTVAVIQGAYKLSENFALRLVGETAISLQHWFTLFPRDGSSEYRTIPNVTFTVCNRHEFHDLATLPVQRLA